MTVSYTDRKGFPSINVMEVSDHRTVFTNVFVDRAGSVHDARVLKYVIGQKWGRNSSVKSTLSDGITNVFIRHTFMVFSGIIQGVLMIRPRLSCAKDLSPSGTAGGVEAVGVSGAMRAGKASVKRRITQRQ